MNGNDNLLKPTQQIAVDWNDAESYCEEIKKEGPGKRPPIWIEEIATGRKVIMTYNSKGDLCYKPDGVNIKLLPPFYYQKYRLTEESVIILTAYKKALLDQEKEITSQIGDIQRPTTNILAALHVYLQKKVTSEEIQVDSIKGWQKPRILKLNDFSFDYNHQLPAQENATTCYRVLRDAISENRAIALKSDFDRLLVKLTAPDLQPFIRKLEEYLNALADSRNDFGYIIRKTSAKNMTILAWSVLNPEKKCEFSLSQDGRMRITPPSKR